MFWDAETGMDPLGWKVICGFVILVIKLVFGLLPCSFHEPLKRLAARTPARRKYFSMCVGCVNCFAAGILLSLSILHILPTCQKIADDMIGKDLSQNKFPLAEMLTVLGIYVVLMVDRSIHCIQRSQCRSEPTPANSKESISSNNGYPTLTSYDLRRTHSITEDEIDMSDIIAENHTDMTKPKLTPLTVNEHGVSLPVALKIPVEHKEFQALYVDSVKSKSARMAIFFVIALSFHGLFSGLVVGFQAGAIDVWMAFVGVALREIVLSFRMGLELVRHTDKGVRYQSLIGIAGSSAFSAIGIVIGTLMESSTYYNTSMVSVVAIFHCIANGGLLYIVFFEIFQTEMENNYRFPNVISSLVGFAAMTFCIGIVP